MGYTADVADDILSGLNPRQRDAAFDMFEPVHDAITRGLSLVNPLGMAAALWVWRRTSLGSSGLRRRAALLVALLASLVSATACTSTDLGITLVEFDEDGTLVTRASSWDGPEVDEEDWEGPGVGEQSVETPRGNYSIEESDVVQTIDGRTAVAYSAAYLRERGNINVQTHATMHLAPRLVTTKPYSIAYDQQTGNLAVAMGLQGIVVGTPDGRWTREAVGRYTPTDFSIVRKLLMSGDWGLWLLAAAAALSFTALAMAMSEPASALRTISEESTASTNRSDSPISVGWVLGILFVMVILSSILLQISSGPYFVVLLMHIAFLILIIPLTPVLIGRFHKNGRAVVSVFAIIASTIGMVYYPDRQGLLSPFLSLGGGALGVGLAVLVGAESYMELRRGLFVTSFPRFLQGAHQWADLKRRLFVASLPDGGLLPVIAAAVGGMLALVALSFFLWVQLGIHWVAAMFSAIGSMALMAFILRKYLKGMMPTNPPR